MMKEVQFWIVLCLSCTVMSMTPSYEGFAKLKALSSNVSNSQILRFLSHKDGIYSHRFLKEMKKQASDKSFMDCFNAIVAVAEDANGTNYAVQSEFHCG